MMTILFLTLTALIAWLGYTVWVMVRLLRRIRELDHPLAYLCVQAFTARHIPIWTAWSMGFGDIEVTVTQSRRDTVE